MFFVDGFGHERGEWSDQSIAQQNTEECADQRGGNFVPDFFGRPAKGAHRDHNAQDGGDDSKTSQ